MQVSFWQIGIYLWRICQNALDEVKTPFLPEVKRMQVDWSYPSMDSVEQIICVLNEAEVHILQNIKPITLP